MYTIEDDMEDYAEYWDKLQALHKKLESKNFIEIDVGLWQFDEGEITIFITDNQQGEFDVYFDQSNCQRHTFDELDKCLDVFYNTDTDIEEE